VIYRVVFVDGKVGKIRVGSGGYRFAVLHDPLPAVPAGDVRAGRKELYPFGNFTLFVSQGEKKAAGFHADSLTPQESDFDITGIIILFPF
jgi:hypothetical protein